MLTEIISQITNDGGVGGVSEVRWSVCCVCWGRGTRPSRSGKTARITLALWSSHSHPPPLHARCSLPLLLNAACFAQHCCARASSFYLVPLCKGFDLTGDEVAVAVVTGVFRRCVRAVLHEGPRDASVVIG